MAQSMRPISTVTDQGNFTGATAHGSVDGTAPDTGDYWNGNDNQTDVLEVLLTDLSGSTPDTGTCTVSIYQTQADTDSAPASGGNSATYDLEVYEGATQRAARTSITATDSAFTLDSNLTFAASAITDWSDVRARFTSYGTGGTPSGRRGAALSYIDISTPDAASADTTVAQNAVVALSLATLAATVSLDIDVQQTSPVALTLAPLQSTISLDVDISQNAPSSLGLTAFPATIVYDVDVQQTSPAALSVATLQASILLGADVQQTAPVSLGVTTNQATITYDVDVQQTAPVSLGVSTFQSTVVYDVDVQQNAPALLSVTTLPATVQLGVNVEQTAPVSLGVSTFAAGIAYDIDVQQAAPAGLSIVTFPATVDSVPASPPPSSGGLAGRARGGRLAGLYGTGRRLGRLGTP